MIKMKEFLILSLKTGRMKALFPTCKEKEICGKNDTLLCLLEVFFY